MATSESECYTITSLPESEEDTSMVMSESEDMAASALNHSESATQYTLADLNQHTYELERVLSFVGAHHRGIAACVCRCWHDVIYLRGMWRGLQRIKAEANMENMVPSLRTRGINQVQIRSTNLDAIITNDDSIQERFGRQLCYLTMNMVNSLAKLDLSHVYIEVKEEFLLQAFNEAMPYLSDLILSDHFISTNQVVCRIAENCVNLETLEVPFSYIDDHTVAVIGSKLQTLDRFSLESCGAITAIGARNIKLHMPQLRFLDLSRTDLKDADIRHIAQLKDLRSLSLCGCRCLSAACIDILSQHNSPVNTLTLTCLGDEPGDEVLKRLGQSKLHLIDVKVGSWCGPVTDSGIAHFLGQTQKQLRYIEIGGHCNVTDNGLADLAQVCVDLYYILIKDKDVLEKAKQALEERKKNSKKRKRTNQSKEE